MFMAYDSMTIAGELLKRELEWCLSIVPSDESLKVIQLCTEIFSMGID